MRGVVLLLALSTIGCNLTAPDDDLTGTWIARSIGHSSLVGFTLRQTGDTISGTFDLRFERSEVSLCPSP